MSTSTNQVLFSLKTEMFLLLDDLTYAVKGGRVSSKIKTIANLLRLKPILIANKSGKLKAFFTTDKNSPYFESRQFSKVLEYLKKNFRTCEMKEKNGKLSFVVKDISELKTAISFCKKISLNESLQQDLSVMQKGQE